MGEPIPYITVAGKAMVEEAFVAILAAIGALHQHVVKEPLSDATSSRAVCVIAAAIGALDFAWFRFGLAHGHFLAGRSLSYTFHRLRSTFPRCKQGIFNPRLFSIAAVLDRQIIY